MSEQSRLRYAKEQVRLYLAYSPMPDYDRLYELLSAYKAAKEEADSVPPQEINEAPARAEEAIDRDRNKPHAHRYDYRPNG